jgi:hypothetical protein
MDEKKKEIKKPPTLEELKAAKEARAKARKEDSERSAVMEAKVPHLSFRQLRGELKRQARKPNDTSPLTSALAAICLTILDNTRTPQNPNGKLEAFPR